LLGDRLPQHSSTAVSRRLAASRCTLLYYWYGVKLLVPDAVPPNKCVSDMRVC